MYLKNSKVNNTSMEMNLQQAFEIWIKYNVRKQQQKIESLADFDREPAEHEIKICI